MTVARTTAYDVGDDVRLGLVVETTAGTKVNTGVTLLIAEPASATASAATLKYGPVTSTNSTVLDNTTTGTWTKLHKVNRPGRHTFQWLSTGTVVLSTGGAWTVRPFYAST